MAGNEKAAATAVMDDEPKPIKLQEGQRLGGWRVKTKLGEGGFGQVYVVEKEGTQAALKAESNEVEGGSAIKLEVSPPLLIQCFQISILLALNKNGKKPHIPHLYHAAKRKRFCYMVVTLLGENLRNLKMNCPDEVMRPSTWSMLGIQCLYSIKLLHDIGFVHRDIKPANFVMGHENDIERARLVHLLDFGLARSYAYETKNGNWKVRRARATCEFRGTARYCSPSVHLRMEQGRKDDLWSLLYMLIELHSGLPWQREKNKNRLEEMKLNIKDEDLLRKFPEEAHPIVPHLRTLDYYKRPDYSLYRNCLRKIALRENVTFESPYEWEDPKTNSKRTEKPDYVYADFYAADPIRVNSAPPKRDHTTIDAATIEVNNAKSVGQSEH